MKRYYISSIIGDGSMTSPYRAKVSDYPGVSSASIIPTNPLTGAPLFPWAICIASATDHTAILADISIAALPDLSMDAALASLTNAQRNKLFSLMDSRNIDRVGITNQTAFREALRRIGKHLEVAFTENNFDVR